MIKISGCKTDKEVAEQLLSTLELLFSKVVAFTEDECACEPTADEPCHCRNMFGQSVAERLCEAIPTDLLDHLENKYGAPFFE